MLAVEARNTRAPRMPAPHPEALARPETVARPAPAPRAVATPAPGPTPGPGERCGAALAARRPLSRPPGRRAAAAPRWKPKGHASPYPDHPVAAPPPSPVRTPAPPPEVPAPGRPRGDPRHRPTLPAGRGPSPRRSRSCPSAASSAAPSGRATCRTPQCRAGGASRPRHRTAAPPSLSDRSPRRCRRPHPRPPRPPAPPRCRRRPSGGPTARPGSRPARSSAGWPPTRRVRRRWPPPPR